MWPPFARIVPDICFLIRVGLTKGNTDRTIRNWILGPMSKHSTSHDVTAGRQVKKKVASCFYDWAAHHGVVAQIALEVLCSASSRTLPEKDKQNIHTKM